MIDLATLDTGAAANAGADITLRHPITGDDTDISIRVLGRDSDAFKAIESQQLKRRLDRMAKSRKASTPLSIEESEDNALSLLAACTRGWTNVGLDGKELPFTEDNAVMVYRRFAWIRDQVDQAIGDRANFTTPPPAASSSSHSTTSD